MGTVFEKKHPGKALNSNSRKPPSPFVHRRFKKMALRPFWSWIPGIPPISPIIGTSLISFAYFLIFLFLFPPPPPPRPLYAFLVFLFPTNIRTDQVSFWKSCSALLHSRFSKSHRLWSGGCFLIQGPRGLGLQIMGEGLRRPPGNSAPPAIPFSSSVLTVCMAPSFVTRPELFHCRSPPSIFFPTRGAILGRKLFIEILLIVVLMSFQEKGTLLNLSYPIYWVEGQLEYWKSFIY